MRCPKCGYISFDQVDSCSKCGKDVASEVSELQGTAVKAEAPFFLQSAVAAVSSEPEEVHATPEFKSNLSEAVDFDLGSEDEKTEEISVEVVEEEAGADIDFSFDEESPTSISAESASEASTQDESVGESIDFDFSAEVDTPETAIKEEGGAAPAAADELSGLEIDAHELEKEASETFDMSAEESVDSADESDELLDAFDLGDSDEISTLDLSGDSDEGGIEFDLDDFIEKNELDK